MVFSHSVQTVKRSGFTLVELVVVILLLALVASIAVQRLGGVTRAAGIRAAESELALVRSVITGTPTSPGYLSDMESIPGFSPAFLRIGNLLVGTNVYGKGGVRVDDGRTRAGYASSVAFTQWNPERSRGWHGPYLKTGAGTFSQARFPSRDERARPDGPTYGERGFFPDLSHLALPPVFVHAVDGCSVYGFVGEAALLDPWGAPYVLQVPPPQAFADVRNVTETERFHYARIVSAGPDGLLTTPCFYPNTTNSTSSSWTREAKSLSRLAGRSSQEDASMRGDDLVLFLNRSDVFEADE